MTHLKLIFRILFILKVKGLRFKDIHERSNVTYTPTKIYFNDFPSRVRRIAINTTIRV